MKKFFNILFYVSILVFIIYLTQIDYISLSKLQCNVYYLGGAIVLLWIGFYVSTQSWRYALHVHNIHISRQTALISHGLLIFAKYIPGKVWVILGRAGYIAQDKNISAKAASVVSLKEQLIYLLLGLIISFYPILKLVDTWYVPAFILLTILLIALFLFNKPLHDFITHLVKKWFKKELNVPLINLSNVFKLNGVILLYWFLWTGGFCLLLIAFGIPDPIKASFIFPVSAVYGVLAIIFPGGIGVREGIMVSLLTMMGCDPLTATTFSVVSRLWFITGELFIFIVAFIARHCKKN